MADATPPTTGLDALPYPVLHAHPDGKVLYANRALEALAGASPGALLGRTAAELFPHASAAPTGTVVQISAPTGTRGTFRIDRWPVQSEVAGTEAWMLVPWSATPSTDDQMSRRRLATLITSLSDAVMVEDGQRRILLANDAFTQLFGLPQPDTIIGWDCSDAAEQSKHLFAKPKEFVAGVEALLRQRAPRQDDRLRLKDGKLLLRSYVPVVFEDTYQGHMWRYVDVTEREQSRRQLEFEHQRNQVALHASLEAVITVRMDGTIVDWNPSATRIFGWSADEALGRDLADTIIPISQRAAHRAGMLRVRTTGEHRASNRRLRMTAIRRDGGEFPCELVVAPHPDGQHHSGYLRDITDLEAARSELLRVSEAKSELMATLGHDMRSPLTVILHRAELLQEQATDPGTRKSTTSIIACVDQLDGLLRDLSSADGLRSGTLVVNPESFKVEDILGNLVRSREAAASRTGVELRLLIHDRPPAIESDARRLLQIATNLLDNALKYTLRGSIEVACFETEDGVGFRVSDTGVGIAAEDMKHIYTAWFQQDRAAPGSGLGLHIVRRLVQQLGGQITATSKLGAGSTFEVRLPRRLPANLADATKP